jgi:phosphatidylserine/phosphatidylglycerophosphate/cardiolipin synthase-like enzyme
MGAALNLRRLPQVSAMRSKKPAWFSPRLIVVLLAALLQALSACQGTTQSRVIPATPTFSPPASAAPDGFTPATELPFTVFLTDPYAPDAKWRRGGPDEALVTAIDQASLSIDMAMLNLNLKSVTDALLRAQQRGVALHLVTDSNALDGAAFRQLAEAGIPILGDRREGLMHNKFIILDGQEVWSGSLNLTETGTYDDHNNIVRMRSWRIAQNYLTEFNEMFVDDLFGPGSPANTPYPEVTINGRRIEIYFSPDDGVQERLVEKIGSAQNSIHILAFSFTQDELANAMIARAGEGVEVLGVFDAEQYQNNQGGDYDLLRNASLDVRLDSLPGQMHHKVILIDHQMVVFGSYNFSRSAETRNDENVVVVHDTAFTALFEAEFARIFERSQR